MKAILLSLFLIPAFASAQTQKGFAAIGATSLFKEGSSTFGALVNVGIAFSKSATLGAGVEYYKFKGDKTPYFPLYAHLKIYFNENKVRPYITLAPGYGVYNKAITGVSNSQPGSIKGGVFLAGSIGAHFRSLDKKGNYVGPFIQLGVKRLSFKVEGSVIGNAESGTTYASLDLGFRF